MFRGRNWKHRISHISEWHLRAEISQRINEVLLFNKPTREHVEQIVEVVARGIDGEDRASKYIEVELTGWDEAHGGGRGVQAIQPL
ncbi:unnamed protein product [Linum trigynum]|uniref:Uncharacterized protein n=1 Tax=Linum trigynum TaxID=586398 RepID=A0AAV2D5E6_9ROSI